MDPVPCSWLQISSTLAASSTWVYLEPHFLISSSFFTVLFFERHSWPQHPKQHCACLMVAEPECSLCLLSAGHEQANSLSTWCLLSLRVVHSAGLLPGAQWCCERGGMAGSILPLPQPTSHGSPIISLYGGHRGFHLWCGSKKTHITSTLASPNAHP